MHIRPLAILLLLAVLPATSRADEIRLKDGEILYGTIESREKDRIIVRQDGSTRRLPAGLVAEVVSGDDPYKRLADAALEPQDAESNAQLAWFLWRHRHDDGVRLVGRVALEQGWTDRDLHALLGRSPEGEALWHVGARMPYGLDQRWGAARRKALAKGGGSALTEAAVQRALAWLAAHQDEDGKLDADGFMRHDAEGQKTDGAGGGHHGERVPCGYDGVTTAVALMAWLAAGSTPVSGPYRANVARALAWCTAVVRGSAGSAYGLWNYGFCTQAVADAYLMTRAEDLRGVLAGAVRKILAHQRKDGGWSYYLSIGDVPTTGVAASALGMAARAGIGVPKDAVAATLTFLDARVDPAKGRSEYHAGAERKGYTPTRANAAAGLTVRALWGALATTRGLGKQVGALKEKPVWKIEFKEIKTKGGKTVRAQIGNLYPYQWYYTTMALFERGGGSWSRWFGALKSALLKGQRRDGAFAGSWDPLGNYSTSAGRVFITGLCTLMLQAPYRYPRVR